MAVMTSSVDKVPLDLKATSYPSADAMAIDTETNGVHDVLFDEPDAHPSEDSAPPATDPASAPTMNGNHDSPETTAPSSEPAKEDIKDADKPATFLPDSQPDAKPLLNDPELSTASVAQAVEAPTSDVRDEAGPDTTALKSESAAPTQETSESTQQVPETQLPDSNPSDAMETSQDATAPTQDVPASSLESAPTKPMTELSLQTQAATPSAADQEMEDAPTSGKVRSREEDDEDGAPDVKRIKTETGGAEFKVPEVPVHTEQTNGNGAASAAPSTAQPLGQAGTVDVQTALGTDKWPTEAMTTGQNNFLRERLRNTKKIKVANAFKEPVNAEMLNIPNYPLIVQNPMDLGTMETKLKEDRYTSVRSFMEDLDLIVNNTIAFNGKDHPVTQAGYNMRAYFLKGMSKMPKAGVPEPVKPPKPKKPAVPITNKPRRESRAPSAQSPTAPTPTPTTAASPSWPLKPDGTPIVRRDSTTADGRPKREVRQPPSKDLPYNSAKPKKKKYQQELKFCEGVVSEVLKAKYWKFSHPFLAPVDPVALNIPSYLKIIKKPMDFGTIEKNLKDGQYQSAKDFYNDAQLVFQNCFKFNPEGDEVNRMGKQMQELFDKLWKEKADWLAQHAPEPQSGTVYSDEEEEEEEEEEELDPAQAQILAIQEQIAKLNETAQTLLQQQQHKRPSPKASAKKKAGKPATKKKGPLAVPPPAKPAKAKARVKAPAPLSFAQKQEISEGISTLGDVEMRRAVQIIRNGCPHLAHVNDEEMELDMDEIGDDTLRELFKFIKSVKGPKHAAVDEEYEPQRVQKTTTASRPKKNKPMGKKEQEDSIQRIQDQLRHFNNGGGADASGSSQSPPANQDESSDDESSGSESEEE